MFVHHQRHQWACCKCIGLYSVSFFQRSVLDAPFAGRSHRRIASCRPVTGLRLFILNDYLAVVLTMERCRAASETNLADGGSGVFSFCARKSDVQKGFLKKEIETQPPAQASSFQCLSVPRADDVSHSPFTYALFGSSSLDVSFLQPK